MTWTKPKSCGAICVARPAGLTSASLAMESSTSLLLHCSGSSSEESLGESTLSHRGPQGVPRVPDSGAVGTATSQGAGGWSASTMRSWEEMCAAAAQDEEQDQHQSQQWAARGAQKPDGRPCTAGGGAGAAPAAGGGTGAGAGSLAGAKDPALILRTRSCFG